MIPEPVTLEDELINGVKASLAISADGTFLDALTKLTYPNGRELLYDYGANETLTDSVDDDGIDDRLGRVTHLYETVSSTTYVLARYQRTGSGTVVRNDIHKDGSADPVLRFNLAHGTSDSYAGLDRFGRIRHLKWTNYAGTTAHVEIEYGHDKAGNRTSFSPENRQQGLTPWTVDRG